MRLCDVNVLIYAHRPDSSDEHRDYASYLCEMADGDSAYGLSEAVLSGFVRIVTNPKVFRKPTPVDVALDFCAKLRNRPNACVLKPGERNWAIFHDLCLGLPAQGKLVADAWHAALAVEYDCEWVSTDSDFARFRKLRWIHPLRG